MIIRLEKWPVSKNKSVMNKSAQQAQINMSQAGVPTFRLTDEQLLNRNQDGKLSKSSLTLSSYDINWNSQSTKWNRFAVNVSDVIKYAKDLFECQEKDHEKYLTLSY